MQPTSYSQGFNFFFKSKEHSWANIVSRAAICRLFFIGFIHLEYYYRKTLKFLGLISSFQLYIHSFQE